ncbi:Hypothetical protein NTJ_07620 [Nesidiocoris tenuis]|uniref:Uncharacterized protein n=1 Tax=Nesidiocoris tenuis TaxID=355587 RepID=A0ABN7ARI4_9HEMI|nr:Hypothetical protein NTJ_07620 [Nesidiocoris tenuis]
MANRCAEAAAEGQERIKGTSPADLGRESPRRPRLRPLSSDGSMRKLYPRADGEGVEDCEMERVGVRGLSRPSEHLSLSNIIYFPRGLRLLVRLVYCRIQRSLCPAFERDG